MGNVCCCLHSDDYEQLVNTENFLSLRSILHNLSNTYQNLFGNTDVRSSASPVHVSSSSSQDSSISDVFRCPPMPLPYDADVRFPMPYGKGSSHSYEETEPFVEEEKSVAAKEQTFKSQLSDKKVLEVSAYVCPLEDEDLCPTCLEEYSEDNPKITTHCSHHFHLGCIYEWMERSDNCPVCGKVMAFDEP